MRTGGLLAGLVAAAVVIAAAGAFGALAAGGEDGQAVFDQLCKGCHTIGGGKLVGPDLAGLSDRRDQAWVEAFIEDPQAVIDSGDAAAAELLEEYGTPMPALGVSDAQLAALVAFLGYESATPPTETTPTETTPEEEEPVPAGDPALGKRLFEGTQRFEEGGPPCLSCHSLAGVGALGGGQLGPDLTGAYAKFGGDQGLQAALEAVSFPTMAPIFTRRQLTATERAALVAFIQDAGDEERPAGQAAKLVALGAAGALLLALLAAVIWRRRLAGVRKPLVDHAQGRSQ